MDLVVLQEKLLGFASLIYLIATILYIIYLGKRSEIIGKAGTAMGLAGLILHTLGLVFRWWAAGFHHPPFTDLYESLVFFGWGIVVFYLYMEWRYKVRMAGAFVFPIVLAAMGIAVTHQKDIMPLPDALKSWWLHIHVMFASIAYAAFVVAFAFSLMYLIKDRIRREVFGAITSAIAALSLLAVQLRYGAGLTNFVMKKAMMHNGHVTAMRDEAGQYALQIVPKVGPFIMIAAIVLLLAAVFYIIRIYNEEPVLDNAAGGALAIGVVTLAVGIVLIFQQDAKMESISVRVEPFLMALIFFVWLMAGGMLMLHFINEGIIERLPDTEKLDFLSYRSVVVAFPLMTIVIVTGAVWAQTAWGRYWGWDPKETASLVTWFVYAIYLHSRVVAGWKGRPTAIISLVGFLSVVFTYLGVNVFLSGLHSYASSF